MLTPRFKLSQDENHVYITVHAPYTNIADTEVDIDGENFLFVSSPYFLRLRLSGKIVENDKSKGSYDSTSGDFSLTFDKTTPGEHFENLDMITSLLAPKEIPNINPNLVEALEEDGVITIASNDNAENDKASNCHTFGFANRMSSEFRDIGSEFPQIFELRMPEDVPKEDRHKLRTRHEKHKFSVDHYLADFFDEELIEPYLKVTMSWDTPEFDKDAEFTEDEVCVLKELPNKNYLLTEVEYKEIIIGLVDILFGYCYDKRTTLNESTVESSWTINKLSSIFSWFCSFQDVNEVIIASYRRALVYPIFRNFELCNKVKNDVVSLLKHGKKFIVRCLIEIYRMFNSSNDARYILNQLYMKDYLIFIQKCRSEELEDLYKRVAEIEIKKSDLNLDLVMLEEAAEYIQAEEKGTLENEMAVKMAAMSLMPGLDKATKYVVHDEDEDDSSDSSSDSSDSSSDSSSSDDSSSELDSDDEPS